MKSEPQPPTAKQVEKLRLILSTYQDGSGMLAEQHKQTLPGWRDFERAVALVFGGESQENKFIFDVVATDSKQNAKYGISCKMRGQLERLKRDGRVTLELSNSSGKFWDYLKNTYKIDQSNYKSNPAAVGKGLLALVKQWHKEVGIEQGGQINLHESYYLVLSWNKKGDYQLHQFSLDLPAADKLKWYFQHESARCLKGNDEAGTLIEWYGESGGQLKYYPLASQAQWASRVFQLEPLGENTRHALLAKVQSYFPTLWLRACGE